MKVGSVRPSAAVSRPRCSIFDLSIKTLLEASWQNSGGRFGGGARGRVALV
ncbi:hypothetical protein RHIZ404_220890 [Rhizobium sp. EC-SD404]|nr:hypothetical protein RHIZ404_220890 [Rhizobium sp. EC-SD404]